MKFHYRVVPFGTRFERKEGERPVEEKVAAQLLYKNEVAVDVGDVCWQSSGKHARVLDHHFVLPDTGRQPFPVAAAAVLHQAGLIDSAYRGRFETVWLVAHDQPDFDATCAMFLARGVIEGTIPADGWSDLGLKPDRWEPSRNSDPGRKTIDWFNPPVLDDLKRRGPILLAAYAAAVDNSRPIRCPRNRSLHSILYAAMQRRGESYVRKGGAHAFFEEVATILASSTPGLNPLFDSVLEDSPNYVLERQLLDREDDAYRRDLRRARRAVVFPQQAEDSYRDWFAVLRDTPLIRQDGTVEPAHLRADLKRVPTDGIYLRDPESLLFKEWARSDVANSPMGQGFLFTCIAYSQGLPGAEQNSSRYIFALDTERAQGRHLYDVWAMLQSKEVPLVKAKKEPRDVFVGRDRGPGNQPWPYERAWDDPWYDGQNYEATIVDTPNQGTLQGKAGTAADFKDDPVVQVVQQMLEYSIFDSSFHVCDLPTREGIKESHKDDIPIHEVRQRAKAPEWDHLRFARVKLKGYVDTLRPGVARQVGEMLWTILDPDFSEGRPEDVLDEHLVTDATTITVWSRRGVAIAEKPDDQGSTPRSDLYDQQLKILSNLTGQILTLLPPSDSKDSHDHKEDIRLGESLVRSVARLKYDFALPQARPLQCFLESSHLDEVLGMVRDVNTAQALETNIDSIARVQRMMHSVEFFLVAVYSVEWFHALSEGFELKGQWIGWGTFFVAIFSVVLLYILLEVMPETETRKKDPEKLHQQRLVRYLAYMTLTFLFITAAMSYSKKEPASKGPGQPNPPNAASDQAGNQSTAPEQAKSQSTTAPTPPPNPQPQPQPTAAPAAPETKTPEPDAEKTGPPEKSSAPQER
jgi:hypothetical protein